MVSEIKGSAGPAAQGITPGPRKAADQGPHAPSTATPGSDVVTVADLATRLQNLSESVKHLPVVDQALVTEMRDSLANGSYRVDEQQIAEKLTALETSHGRLERE
jgi:negative regulator of flagellin synthesis FlgM